MRVVQRAMQLDLRQVNAVGGTACDVSAMTQNQSVTLVGSKTARCSGAAENPHDAVEIVLVDQKVAICPSCGRRFRRVEAAGRVNPAAWPKDK